MGAGTKNTREYGADLRVIDVICLNTANMLKGFFSLLRFYHLAVHRCMLWEDKTQPQAQVVKSAKKKCLTLSHLAWRNCTPTRNNFINMSFSVTH